jgi:hypothetical protein
MFCAPKMELANENNLDFFKEQAYTMLSSPKYVVLF